MSTPSRLKKHLEAISVGIKYLLVKPRLTVMYPDILQTAPKGYRGMIKFSRDRCISCTLCARICPADAIKMHRVDDRKFPGINYLRCIFCGFCVDVCPKTALEHTGIHDAAHYTREEQVFTPAQFSEAPQTPPLRKKPRMAKVEFDERSGLKYERS